MSTTVQCVLCKRNINFVDCWTIHNKLEKTYECKNSEECIEFIKPIPPKDKLEKVPLPESIVEKGITFYVDVFNQKLYKCSEGVMYKTTLEEKKLIWPYWVHYFESTFEDE